MDTRICALLLFDSAGLLTREECIYTDGNFASIATQVGTDAQFLRRRDFHSIYHDSAFTPESRDAIIRARCAEVLFHTEVDIDDLRDVVCRTPAERTTLLVLLGDQRKHWVRRVRVEEAGERLFFREGAYVLDCMLAGMEVIVRLRIPSGARHDCEAFVRTKSGAEVQYKFEAPVGPELRLRVPGTVAPERVSLEVRISDSLAYLGAPSQQTLF